MNNQLSWTIVTWIDNLLGETSNYEFFVYLNSGWLKMQFEALYGPNPSEQDCWEWMFKNAETIRLSEKDYDEFVSRLDS
jgi:hypothetical protein